MKRMEFITRVRAFAHLGRMTALALSIVLALPALAQVAFSVDNIFGDHMVLQRGKPIRVSGNAEAEVSITAKFRGEARTAKADANGRWALEFSPADAGGPYEMTFIPNWEKGRSFSFRDILVGDVWVCSGQSNMSFPVWEGGHQFFRLPDGSAVAKAAHDGRLRLYNGCKSIASSPCTDMTGRPQWHAANTPQAVSPFSAVGYFFGKKLREALDGDIPVGMINSSWGGTRIEPWIAEGGYVGDAVKPVLATPEEFASWQRRFYASDETKSADALANWGAIGLDTSAWKKAPHAMMGGLATPGIAWYRFEFTVDDGAENDDFVFHMDTVNDADETFLDGTKIGETGPLTGVKEYWHAPRNYAFHAKAGRHVIAVRAADHYGTGYIGEGVWIENRTKGVKTDFTDAEWLERVEFKMNAAKIGMRPEMLPDGVDPRSQRDYPTGLYNAMINPVSQMNVRGVIWYQGCSNSGAPDRYGALEKALFDSWRTAFRDPSLPFIVTQLSALEKHTPAKRLADDWWKMSTPDRLGFAPLREVQDKMSAYPNTGLACTIDLGDPCDIHPIRKAEVADRLAREALRVAYGRRDILPGPRFASMRREGAALRISFKDTGDGLEVRGGAIHPHMFAVAAEGGPFVWADARFEADGTVTVWNDGVAEPVAVRYAYSACPPKTTIYRKGDGLPLFPFNEKLSEPDAEVSVKVGDVSVGSVQRAIDIVAAQGGGCVIVPAGDYPIAFLEMKSNVTLALEKGARLYAETNALMRFAQRERHEHNQNQALIVSHGAKNIAITGPGVIDGLGYLSTPLENNRPGRWKLIILQDTDGIRLEDVTLTDSASWTCYFQRCRNVTARRVKIDGHANYNNDGFDIEASNVLIEDCDIDCEDDCICGKIHDPSFVSENVVVRNCRLSSNCNFVKLGTASYGTYRNWYVHDIKMSRCRAAPLPDLQWATVRKIPGVTEPITGLAGIALEAVDGGRIENIHVANVEMASGVQTPIFLRVGARKGEGGNDWNFRNVTIENVKGSSCSWIASSITGVPSRRLGGNIVLRNIDLLLKGDSEYADGGKPVPEAERDYPENRMFGTILPAYGLYIRHADGIRMENVKLRHTGTEKRPPVVCDDAHDVISVD